VTPEQQRWAEALQVVKMKSDAAEAFVAERLETLRDDPAGIERWCATGARVAELRAAERRFES
jgi:hypothetical protein